MADTFFEFNTTLTGSLEDELPDEPGHGLEDEDEEEYDALNDETFGAAVEGDWEENHEKLAEIAELSRARNNSVNNGSHIDDDDDDHADLDLEASMSKFMLGDDEPVLENGNASKSKNMSSTTKHFPTSNSNIDLIGPGNYSSSAPPGFSVWSVQKADVQPSRKPSSQTVLEPMKNFCKVEDLERDLISQRNAAASKPPDQRSKTMSARNLEDVERDLTSSYSVVNLGLGRGQPQPGVFPLQDVVTMRNTQNSAALGRGHFQVPLAGPPPQPVLGLGRGVGANPPFGPVVLPSSLLAPHTPPLGIPDLRQLQQQNPRIIGSAPNMVRFLHPPLMMQSQQSNKTLGHQGFPTENGMLHPLHQQNNLPFRNPFQGPLVDQHRIPLPGQYSLRPDRVMGPHFVNNRTPGGNFNLHQGHRSNYSHHGNHNNYRHHHHHMENGAGDHDDYAGLMTNREKQWLQNIQLLVLNTTQPYIDDYYYMVYASRQPKDKRTGDLRRRERRDSHRDRERPDQQGSSKVYTPQQFENSLGKLQVGSVTAPRKIIDMDVVSPEGLDSTVQSVQRDSRKVKQLLLEVERLYLLLMQVEDLTSTVPEVRESVTEDKADLLHKIVTSLVTDDRLTNIMCVHKGKNLLLRVLPHLIAESEAEESHLLHIWSTIFRSLVTIGRRDQQSDVSLLPRFYPLFKSWVSRSKFPAIMEVASNMVPSSRNSSRTASPSTPVTPAKNVLVFALGNKFGVSSLVPMMERVETLYSTLEEKQCHEWSSFMTNLVEALGAVASPSSLPTPIEPIDASTLSQHLGRCSSLCIEKFAVFESVFTRQHKVDLENKENKVNS